MATNQPQKSLIDHLRDLGPAALVKRHRISDGLEEVELHSPDKLRELADLSSPDPGCDDNLRHHQAQSMFMFQLQRQRY